MGDFSWAYDDAATLTGDKSFLKAKPVSTTPASPKSLNQAELEDTLRQAGWNEQHIPKMAAIGMGEGAVDPNDPTRRLVNSYNPGVGPGGVPTKEKSMGLWQINMIDPARQAKYDANRLKSDPVYNAKVALELFNERQAKGLNPFTHWGAYSNGSYKKFYTGKPLTTAQPDYSFVQDDVKNILGNAPDYSFVNEDVKNLGIDIPTTAPTAQPVTPTNPVQALAPATAAPVPETANTLQSQVVATLAQNSPKSMTLLTPGNPVNNYILSMVEAKRLTRVNLPDGSIGLVNASKIGLQPNQVADYIKQNGYAGLIGKAEDVGNATGPGQPAVHTMAPDGTELSSSVVTTPQAAEQQINLDQQAFPGSQSQVTTSDAVIAKRAGQTAEQPVDLSQPAAEYPGKTYGQVGQSMFSLPQTPSQGFASADVKMIPQSAKLPAPQKKSVKAGSVSVSLNPSDFKAGDTPITDYTTGRPTADGGTVFKPRNIGQDRDQADGLAGTFATTPTMSEEDAYRSAALNIGGDYGVTPSMVNAQIARLRATGKPLINNYQAGQNLDVTFGDLKAMGADTLPGQRMERAQARQELEQTPQQPAGRPTGNTLYDQAVRNVLDNPFSGGGTSEEIDAELKRLQATTPTEEEKANDKFAGEMLKTFDPSLGISTGLLKGASWLADIGAGLARFGPVDLLNSALGTNLAGTNDLHKLANRGRLIAASSKKNGFLFDVTETLGQAGVQVPVYVGLSTLPGGAVLAFAATEGLGSAGRGENPLQIAGHTMKGGALGALFAAAPRVQGMTEDLVLNAAGSDAGKGAVLASRIFGTAANIGTIGTGTFAVEKAAGASNKEAFNAAIVNSLFGLTHLAGDALALAGKVFRMYKGGKAVNVTVDPDGTVKLLKGEVPPGAVDAEINLDKAIDVELDANGVYRAPGDTTPIREKEVVSVGNRGNRIGTTTEPAQLESTNAQRIEVADPKAVEKVSTDKRVRKVLDNLTGEFQTVDEIAKATKYAKPNVEAAILDLYGAKMVEILPGNRVRLINPEETVKQLDIFEKAKNYGPTGAQNAPQTGRPKPTVIQPSPQRTAQRPNVTTPQPETTTEPDIQAKTDETYQALPQQKPQVEEVAKPQAQVITKERPDTAKTLNVFTERGTKASIEPKVVDSSDILTSMDEGYPTEFQPRDRSRIASKAQISKIASDLNPEFLGDSAKAGDGRPLVVPVMIDGKEKYAVISGNGRTQAIREAYNAGNKGSEAYRSFVASKGDTQHPQPVYVGVLDPNEVDLKKFAGEANESAVAKMSPTEQAQSDARNLHPGIMSSFMPADDGSIHPTANRDFIQSFFDANVPDAERGAYIQPDGSLNQDGVNRVRNAIFAKAFGDTKAGADAIQRMAESTSDSVKTITNALLGRAPHLASYKDAVEKGSRYKEYDISNDLATAVAHYAKLKAPDSAFKSLDEYIRQGNMFGADTTPLQTRIMQVYDQYKRSPKALKTIIGNFLSAADAIGDPNQINMFGENTRPSVESLLEGAIQAYERSIAVEPATQQGSLTDQGVQSRTEAGQPSREVAPAVSGEGQALRNAPQAVAPQTSGSGGRTPPPAPPSSGDNEPPEKQPTRGVTTIPDAVHPTPAERDLKPIPLSVKRSMVRREMAKPDADPQLIAEAYGLPVDQVLATRELGPVGPYGQMSHILRAGLASDLPLLNKVAKAILPEARVNDNNPLFSTGESSDAILDKIAEMTGYPRSSHMGKEGLIRFLDTHADRLPMDFVVLVHDSIAHYEEWYRKRAAAAEELANSPVIQSIIAKSIEMGEPAATSYQELTPLNKMPKALKATSWKGQAKDIWKKYKIEVNDEGTRYTGLSEPVFAKVFNEVLHKELSKIPNLRISTAGTRTASEKVNKTGEAKPDEGQVDDGILFANIKPAPQVGTSAFKKFFKASQVVDENGSPLVVYHGTISDFDRFENIPHQHAEDAWFFTSSASDASNFALGYLKRYETPGAQVMPAYLSLQDPLTVDFKGKVFDYDKVSQLIADAKSAGNDGIIIHNIRNMPKLPSEDFRQSDKRSTTYIAFKPAQIKSAIGNRGTFDPNEPSILMTAFDQTDLFGNPVTPQTSQGKLPFSAPTFTDSGRVKDMEQAYSKPTADYVQSLLDRPETTDPQVYRTAVKLSDNRYLVMQKGAGAKRIVEDAADALDAFALARQTQSSVDDILKQGNLDGSGTVGDNLSPQAVQFAKAMETGMFSQDFSKALSEVKTEPEMQMASVAPHKFTLDVSDRLGRKLTVYKNPTPTDYQAVRLATEDRFGKLPTGEPTSRMTVDEQGNKYIWSSVASHRQVEPALFRQYGIKTNQNGDFSDIQFMVAWHGSPHRFDKFDSSKIGTGEGAQAYGHGLYFTDKEAVADWYKNNLTTTRQQVSYKGEDANTAREKLDRYAQRAFDRVVDDLKFYPKNRSISRAIHQVRSQLLDLIEHYRQLKDNDKRNIDPIQRTLEGSNWDIYIDGFENELDAVRKFKAEDFAVSAGAKYRVDLKPSPDEYLLWDKPLSEQSEKVKKALETVESRWPDDARGIRGLSGGDFYAGWLRPRFSESLKAERDRLRKDQMTVSSADEHQELGERIQKIERQIQASDVEASDYLKSLGIRGIKYLDGSSRGKGEGSYNYVLFDAADAEILDIQHAKPSKIQQKIEDGKTKRLMGNALSMSYPALIARAKMTPENGVLKMNAPALVLFTKAVQISAPKHKDASFIGAALNPSFTDTIQGMFDIAPLLQTGVMAKRMQTMADAVRAATDPVHGDLIVVLSDPSIPFTSKHTLQEEYGHRADNRLFAEHPELFAQKPFIGAKDYATAQKHLLEVEQYPISAVHREILGKMNRDDAADALGLTQEGIDNLQEIFESHLETLGVSPDKFRQFYKNISEATNKRIAQYEQRSSAISSGQRARSNASGSGEGGLTAGSPTEVRTRSRSGGPEALARAEPRPDESGIRQREFLEPSESGIGSRLARLNAAALPKLPANEQRYITRQSKGDEALSTYLTNEVQFARLSNDKMTILDYAIDVLNMPKAIKASVDLSAFRQGGITSLAHPVIATRAFRKQINVLGPIHGHDNFKKFETYLNLHPFIELAEESKLYLASLAGEAASEREEAFMSRILGENRFFKNNKWEAARKLGTYPVRASERAFKTFLDDLRINVFATLAKALHKANQRTGKPDTPEQYKGLATFINYATGRGDLGRFNEAAPLFNAAFFSMRYWMSRLQVMNPFFYAKLPPGARSLVLKDLFTSLAAMAAVGLLLKLAGGKIDYDNPNDPNTLKVGFGNYTYDISFGLLKHLRYAARMAMATQEKDPTGKMTYLTERYMRSSIGPVPGGAWSGLAGVDYVGQPTDFKNEAMGLFTPIMVDNYVDAMKADGFLGFVKMTPEFFGISTSRFAKEPELRTKMQKEAAKGATLSGSAQKESDRKVKVWQKLIDRNSKYSRAQ